MSSHTDRRELLEALQVSLRRWAGAVGLYEAAVADRLGLHPTDVQFLGLVQLYGPTTAGRLAELGGLTTGAVTGVLDRLEGAGYVARSADPDDRRRVVVAAVEARAGDVGALYRTLNTAAAEVYDRYSDDELAIVLDVADRLPPLLEEQAARLRAQAPADATKTDRRGERPAPPDTLSAPRAGLAEATLRFPRGAGHVGVMGDPSVSELYVGDFLSTVATAKVDRGIVSVQFRKSPFGWRAKHGRLRLNADVAWRLELVGGCSRFDADLTQLRLLGLSLTGGASHVRLKVGPPQGVVSLRLTGGVNDLTVVRPAGTAARLRVKGGAANVVFDGQRWGAVGGDNRWASGDDGPDRYEFEITGGARTVVVTTDDRLA